MTGDTIGTIAVETSFAQQSLWLQNQIDPGQPTYNVTAALRLRGRLDAAVVGQALNEVIDRHEGLRTVFELRAGVPFQLIGPRPPAAVPVRAVGPDDVGPAVRAEVTRPFDLAH